MCREQGVPGCRQGSPLPPGPAAAWPYQGQAGLDLKYLEVLEYLEYLEELEDLEDMEDLEDLEELKYLEVLE